MGHCASCDRIPRGRGDGGGNEAEDEPGVGGGGRTGGGPGEGGMERERTDMGRKSRSTARNFVNLGKTWTKLKSRERSREADGVP